MKQTDERGGASTQSGAGSRDDVSGLGEKARATAGDAAQAAFEQARDGVEEKKAAAADNVVRLSRAVHGAADQLGKELPQAAGYIHSAADRLQNASSTLRNNSVEDLAAGFTDFARKQPVAAFVGSVLAGFALSRFLKSSNAQPRG